MCSTVRDLGTRASLVRLVRGQRGFRWADKRLKYFPNQFQHLHLGLTGRMDAVGLKVLRTLTEALEQKRDESDSVGQ